MGIGHSHAIALSLIGLGAVASVAQVDVTDGEQTRRGARLLGAAEAMLKAIGAALEPESRAVCEYGVTSARARLGEEVFEQARQEGWAMNMEEAADYALREMLGNPQAVH